MKGFFEIHFLCTGQKLKIIVMPAKAGTQECERHRWFYYSDVVFNIFLLFQAKIKDTSK